VLTPKRDQQELFHREVLAAYERHGFKSYRHAEQVTGVNYSTIYAIVSRGRIPTRGQVIEWAEGLAEPINRWLGFAGYDPISSPVENGSLEKPREPVAAVEYALANAELSDFSRDWIINVVRMSESLTDESKAAIADEIRRKAAANKRKHHQ
jgi:hypothetical protein